MTAIDHVIAALLALACVAQLFVAFEPADHDRMSLYRAGAASGLLFAAAPTLGWWAAGRPLDGFGLHGWSAPDLGTVAAGAAWALLLAACLVLVRRGALRSPVASVYRRYAWIMPRSRAELRASWATAIVAGCGEEIAFRGFLLWYCAAAVGAPAGLLATSLLFGAAHSYQRSIGMVFATVAGLVIGGFYLASGSLILAMWMHATWNLASFTAGRTVLGAGEGGEGPL